MKDNESIAMSILKDFKKQNKRLIVANILQTISILVIIILYFMK